MWNMTNQGHITLHAYLYSAIIYQFIAASFQTKCPVCVLKHTLATEIQVTCKTYKTKNKAGESSLDTQKYWESEGA